MRCSFAQLLLRIALRCSAQTKGEYECGGHPRPGRRCALHQPSKRSHWNSALVAVSVSFVLVLFLEVVALTGRIFVRALV